MRRSPSPECDEIESKNRLVNTDTLILVWQTMAESCSTRHRSCCCTTRKTVPSPVPLDIDCLKGMSVTSIVVAMIVIFVVVACTVGLVLLGMEGRGKQRAPKLADRMSRAAQHLNGDGEPPARLIKLIESGRDR